MDSKPIMTSAAAARLDYGIHAHVLTYLDLKTIASKMLVLSRDYNEFVKNENYTLYKRFLRLFCLNHNKKKDDLIAQCNILQVLQECCLVKETQSEDFIKCYAFYTDGGAYQNSNTYFLYRLHGDGNTLYSTIKISDTAKKGVNIQVYMGREAEYNTQKMSPVQYRIDPKENIRIQLPIESQLTNPYEEETYKMLTEMTIDKHCTGYTCFVHTFAIFVSDREVDCEKSNVLQAFAGVQSIEKFMAMGLDLVCYSQPNTIAKKEFADLDQKTKRSTVFEIDLSNPKKLLKALRKASGLSISSLDCYPLFWCQQEKVSQKWAVAIKQNVVCKYHIIKLLSRAPGSSTHDANMDMFPLEFRGYTMPIPNSEAEQQALEEQRSPKKISVEEMYGQFNMMNTYNHLAFLTGQSNEDLPILMQANDLGHCENSDEPQKLTNTINVNFYPKQIKIQADWSDQGWGNKKARLILRLYRKEKMIHEQDIFGICNRKDPTQRERSYVTSDAIVNKCIPGDKYCIYGVSGGGGGHQITVASISMFVAARINDKRQPLLEVQDYGLGNMFAAEDDEYY